MREYACVLGIHVVESISRLPARLREELLRAFDTITDRVHEPESSRFKDESGRWISEKTIGRWQIAYWVDGPVWEVRIVGVQRIRP